MMEIQFAEIQNFVTDLSRARHFYEVILKLKKKKEGPGWLVYDLSGTDLVVKAGAKNSGLRKYGEVTGTSISLRSKNIEADVKQLKAAGVKLQGKIQQFPQGKMQAFTDPDGNFFELIQ